ncbi:MAG: hypothetical protein KC468_37855 [Myxococcales bacterium]|nr:hypothetical protein [Myxococcales bacterium]
MTLAKLTVGALRGRQGKLKRQQPGMDAAVASAFTLAVAWPLTHYFSVGGGFLEVVFYGVGGSIAMLVACAFSSGILEVSLERQNLDGIGWVITSLIASVIWWSVYPGIWPPLVLMAVSLGMFARAYYGHKGGQPEDPELRGLPPELAMAIAQHPKRLDSDLKRRLNSALADYSDLHELLTQDGGELARDPAIDADKLLGDAVELLRALNDRVRVLRRLEKLAKRRASERVSESLTRARGQLDDLQSSLHSATEAVMVYAAESGEPGSAERLREEADRLRLVMSSMQELNGRDPTPALASSAPAREDEDVEGDEDEDEDEGDEDEDEDEDQDQDDEGDDVATTR